MKLPVKMTGAVAGGALLLAGGAALAAPCASGIESARERWRSMDLDAKADAELRKLFQAAEQYAGAGSEDACAKVVQRVEVRLERLALTQDRAAGAAAERDEPRSGAATAQAEKAPPAEKAQPGRGTARIVLDQPQPEVQVEQPQPQVDIEQPPPQVTVKEQAPKVTVRQQPPQVTVRQAQPTVSVRVPEPEVVVRMPAPEIIVRMAEPQVDVQMPEPQVQVTQAKPEVSVDQGRPDVQVARAELQVEVDQPEPQVHVDMPKPRVQVIMPEPSVNVARRQAAVQVARDAEARVQVERGDPEVRIARAEADVEVQRQRPAISVEQGEPKVRIERAEAEVQVQRPGEQAGGSGLAADQPPAREEERRGGGGRTGRIEQTEQAMLDLRVADLTGRKVVTLDGDDVGKVEAIVVSRASGEAHAVIAEGGFLGIGEEKVAVPLTKLRIDSEDTLVVQFSTEDALENLPGYRSKQFDEVDDEQRRVGDLAPRDR